MTGKKPPKVSDQDVASPRYFGTLASFLGKNATSLILAKQAR
jgi:hypothetical protein